MFHNVEVLPGKSPYTKTEKDCNKYLDILESFLKFCNNNKTINVRLSDLYEIYDRKRKVS
jgi:hypothetical protein